MLTNSKVVNIVWLVTPVLCASNKNINFNVAYVYVHIAKNAYEP